MKKMMIVVIVLFMIVVVNVQNIVMVGGEVMYLVKNIVENVVNFKDYIIFVVVVKVVGLVEIFQGKGLFIVFVLVNDVFENFLVGIVEILLKFENKGMFIKVFIYYVVVGKYDFNDIVVMIKKGNGMVKFIMVEGEVLIVKMNGMYNIIFIDMMGNIVIIFIYDVYQFNGVIYVIDKVLMLKM